MNTYQIRLNQDQSLNQLMVTLAEEIAGLLETRSELQPFKRPIREGLMRALAGFFNSLIRTYTGCGRDAMCDCGLVAIPSAPQNLKPLDSQEPVKRLILDIPTNLENFLKDIEGVIARTVFEETGGNTWPVQNLQKELEALIKTVLARFIFRSAVCSQSFICMNRKAVNPWEASAV